MRFLLAFLGSLLALHSPLPAKAQAAHSLTLAWDYTQSAQRPATAFVVQRCVQMGTTCQAPLADLPGATALPVGTLTYVDSTIQTGQVYCYVVLAADATRRSAPSNQACGGAFDLTVPTTLHLTIQ